MGENESLQPRIYVACLAAYNSGALHGTWIDVGDDLEALYEATYAMLVASPVRGAEEYAIHDYEDFGGVELSESIGLKRVVEIAAFLRKRGRLGALVLNHLDGDLEAAARALDDDYSGVFPRLADYFQERTEETVSIPEPLRLYIDYEAMARDAVLGGEVFTLETAHDRSTCSGRARRRPNSAKCRVATGREPGAAPFGAPRRVAGFTETG